MKRLLFALYILTVAAAARADFQNLPANVQANLPAIQKYPRASCVLLWCKEDYTLNTNGSRTYEWHSFRYLPDDAARDAWGDPHVAYFEGSQTLEILTARTYTRDGRTIDSTPENAFNPIVPEGGYDLAPDYTDLRQMVVTMLGLEDGCISEFRYRITTAQPVLPWLEGRVYFREPHPVIARELVVNLPPGVQLNYKAENGVAAAAQTGTTYSWKTDELRGYLAEDLAAHRVLLPNVAFTTAPSWEAVNNFVFTRIADAQAAPLPLPASLLKELQTGVGDDNRLNTVKAWVRDRFNLLDFDLPDFQWRLRPIDRILESGYGNPQEMAMLVAGVSHAAGLTGEVAAAWYPFAPPVPSVHDVANWLIGLNGVPLSTPLDPADKFPRLARTGGYYMFRGGASASAVPWSSRFAPSGAPPASFNLDLVCEDLSTDTLRGRGQLTARGAFAPFEQLYGADPAKYLATLVSLDGIAVKNARLRQLDVLNVVLDFDFAAAGAVDTVDGRRLVPGAVLNFVPFLGSPPLSLTTREFPQEIPVPGEITCRITIPYSGDWKPESRPSGSDLVLGECRAITRSADEVDLDTDANGGTDNVLARRVVLARTLHLRGQWLPSEHWKNLREWLLFSGPQAGHPVVFAPVKK